MNDNDKKKKFFEAFFDKSFEGSNFIGLGSTTEQIPKLNVGDLTPNFTFPGNFQFHLGSVNYTNILTNGITLPSASYNLVSVKDFIDDAKITIPKMDIPLPVPKLLNTLMKGGIPFFGETPNSAATKYWEFYKWKLRNGYEDLFDTESAADFAMAGLKILAADLANDGGVSYESNGADYAEWLPKADTTVHFNIGEIVAVKDGKISKNTQDFDNIMIISSRPIVLGNTPPVGEEANYTKVGFMGQVSTLVKGKVNVGDYII
ncbi:MAG: hypothetical protein ACKVJP_11460, partial [Flavobacteriales bacterium]